MDRDPLYLVDASIYIFRGYYSIPDTFVSRDGTTVNAVYGYTRFLLDLLDRVRPRYLSVAFDENLVTCFRNRIYADYKANRDLPDANLVYQVAQCQRVTQLLGCHSLTIEDYEADDIIGSLKRRFGEGRSTVIVTRDKDLGQLLDDGDELWDFADDRRTDPAGVRDKFGVEPDQIADYLALAGDTVDNIPGAPGIGAKTAAALLGHFGTLEAILAEPERVLDVKLRGASRISETLVTHAALLRTFRELTGIVVDIETDATLDDLGWSPDRPGLVAFCDEMDFGRGVRDSIERLSPPAG